MIQYLFNATAIWLISLLMYDLLLRRESFHAYNRLYLLGTLIVGIVLPLVPVLPGADTSATILRSPARTMATARQAIIAATPAATTQGSSLSWLQIIYLSGLSLGITYLVANIVKLARYYRYGKKQLQGRWTIVETGKGHAPFSFRYMLFVNSIQEYSTQEWHMICRHEEAHTRLLHIADLLLLHAARMLFWFHPLVYVYHKRLLMVHEYQADTAAATEKEEYGHFLIEQALLHAAPSVAHSFHYSPIKNRLVMLYKKSSRKASGKMLLLAPLLLVFVACFAKESKSRKMVQDNYSFTYPGTKVELTKTQVDTIMMTDPVSGAEIMRVTTVDPIPVKVDGKEVQYIDKQPRPIVDMMDRSADKMEDYLLDNLKPMLEKLEDGKYFFGPGNSVVSTEGRIVYYQYWGVRSQGYANPDTALTKEIDRKTIALMETMPKLGIWEFNKETAPYAIDGFFSLQVSGHKIVKQ
jgi:hypothetical protein